MNRDLEQIKKRRAKTVDFRQFTLLFVLLAEIIIFACVIPNFWAASNLVNVLRQVSITAIASTGMFMIILLGDIDLSIGSMYAFIGVICALLFVQTNNAVLSIVCGLAMGTGIGWAKGFITAKGKIPSFVTTLAFMSICRGLARVITGGSPVGVNDTAYTDIGAGYLFGSLPIPVVLMIVVLLAGFFITNYTRFGRYIYAVGGNEQASRWSGLRTDFVRIVVFTLAGFFTGMSALILSGRLGGGLPEAGSGAEMDAITAVILGGTSLTGGRGKLWGVVLGVFVIGVLSNGLTMLKVSSYWQEVLKGIIILIAVLLDSKKPKNA